MIAVLCVGPLALPLIWLRPDTSRAWKTGLTLVILAFSWRVYRVTMGSVKILQEYYELLRTM